MKKDKSLTNRSGLFGAIMFVLALSMGVSSCRPDFDLDTRFPEWLGTSIYETLEKGFKNDSTGQEYTFKTFIRLIDDLDQKDILAKTGSKTLFVADDAAFDKFFKNCPFTKADGTSVKNYDELSTAQKRMILNGSMLNNVYQVAMLSSSPGGNDSPPILGNCMRRVSAAETMDTIPVVLPENLPDNKYWRRLKNKSDKGVVLLQDGTNKPIIFFVNKFLEMNKIDNDDYDFLFRLGPTYSRPNDPKPKHVPGDASVNGITIAWPNKKCFNGFLHVMSEVVYLLPNMADYISTYPDSKIYSAILDRFSVPYYYGPGGAKSPNDATVRRLIDNKLVVNPLLDPAMRANDDSVYVKKYLAKRARLGSQTETESQSTNFDKLDPTNDLLKFDPGWNSFVSSTVGNNSDVALQRDMGLMFVPLDESLKEWWLDSTQIGASLRARYGDPALKGRTDLTVEEVIQDMKGIPDDVIIELVNNNMQTSLVSSVPSKFSSVLNDAQDPFFDKRSRKEAEETISDVVMCCNGAVYFTTTVYVPTAYKSVSYPVLVNEKLKIIDWAIKDETLAYRAYLNSMVAEYSFFVPLVEGAGSEFEDKLVWIDPASFYLKKYNSGVSTGSLKALAFSYAKNPHDKLTVIADVYDYDDVTGALTPTDIQIVPDVVTTSSGEADNNDTKFIRNRLLDLMDYHIIIGDVEENGSKDANGYSYFRTKGRGTIRFKNAADFHDMEVSGGWQIENDGEPDEIQRPVKVVQRYDLNPKTNFLTPGNGRTYVLDRPLLPSRKSVYDILSDADNYPEFQSFFKLMETTGIFAQKSNMNDIASLNCISSFNTYHYTVYVPQNSSVDAMVTDKLDATTKSKLMLPETLAKLDTLYKYLREELKDDNGDSTGMAMFKDSLIDLSVKLFGSYDEAKINSAMNAEWPARSFTNRKLDQLKNFVKYHIQDNSVYIGADFDAGVDDYGNPATKAEYETAFMNENQQFVKVTVKGGDAISIFDKNGHTRTVQQTTSATGKPYYNIMCREYEIKSISDGALSEGLYDDFSIETSSYAVVHLIDAPLCNGDVIF